MFENTIFLKNINNYKFNFKKILKTSNTLLVLNCSNLELIIKSKINRIIIHGTNKINIKICDMISGIEIVKSKEH